MAVHVTTTLSLMVLMAKQGIVSRWLPRCDTLPGLWFSCVDRNPVFITLMLKLVGTRVFHIGFITNSFQPKRRVFFNKLYLCRGLDHTKQLNILPISLDTFQYVGWSNLGLRLTFLSFVCFLFAFEYSVSFVFRKMGCYLN